ncbi:MAG: hypothetical protein V1927_05790 [Candidatus Omnitrophota bacterium]
MPEEKLIKFPYVREVIRDPISKEVGEACRPIIPVRLIRENKSCRFLGLIDSGADECTFPGAIAEFLGHNLMRGKARVFSGIGGAVVSYLHQTDLEISGIRFRTNIYYSNEWNKMGFGLLGQAGFFSHFKVLLDHRAKEIVLTHHR